MQTLIGLKTSLNEKKNSLLVVESFASIIEFRICIPNYLGKLLQCLGKNYWQLMIQIKTFSISIKLQNCGKRQSTHIQNSNMLLSTFFLLCMTIINCIEPYRVPKLRIFGFFGWLGFFYFYWIKVLRHGWRTTEHN